MTKEVRERLVIRLLLLESELDKLDAGTPEAERIVKEIDTIAKILNEEVKTELDALDKAEKRRVDEEAKKAQQSLEKKKLGVEIGRVIVPPLITGTFSIGGSLMLLKVRHAMEENGKYLTGDIWRICQNYVLKLK